MFDNRLRKCTVMKVYSDPNKNQSQHENQLFTYWHIICENTAALFTYYDGYYRVDSVDLRLF